MKSKPFLSIVIPVYCNEDSLKILVDTLTNDLKRLSGKYELIFVDDNSYDSSLETLVALKRDKKYIKVVKLSRNFGSFNAILAGMSIARGDCIADLTADLQDNPKLIRRMYEQWQKGYEVVLAVRKDRKDGFIPKLFSSLYYTLIRKYALPNMPKGGFDIFLIDRKVANIVLSMNEKNSSLPGQILWTGFNRKLVYYTRRKRIHGSSKWTLTKKIKYFIDSFIAFSYVPIRFMTIVGFITACLSIIYGLFILCNKIFNQIPITGWSSLAVIILFVSSIQMMMLGVIGEYLWRNSEEVKRRPSFIIEKVFE